MNDPGWARGEHGWASFFTRRAVGDTAGWAACATRQTTSGCTVRTGTCPVSVDFSRVAQLTFKGRGLVLVGLKGRSAAIEL